MSDSQYKAIQNVALNINYCYNCGTQVIDKSHKFCNQCGSFLQINKSLPNPTITGFDPLPHHPVYMKQATPVIKSQPIENIKF